MKHYQPNMYYLLSYLRYLDRNKDDLRRHSQERNLSMAVKIMKYSFCNKKAAKLTSSRARNPRLDSMIFFLYSVKTAR